MLTVDDKQWLRGEIQSAKDETIVVSRETETALRGEIHEIHTTLRTEIHEVQTTLRAEIHEIQTKLRAEIHSAKDEMIQGARDMQTEVIRYIGNLAEQFNVRMRHIEANAGNLETAERLRLAALEERLLRIEKRVLGEEANP
jgi:hypothetical protein